MPEGLLQGFKLLGELGFAEVQGLPLGGQGRLGVLQGPLGGGVGGLGGEEVLAARPARLVDDPGGIGFCRAVSRSCLAFA